MKKPKKNKATKPQAEQSQPAIKLDADTLRKIKEADIANIIKKVKAGKPLSQSERKIIDDAGPVKKEEKPTGKNVPKVDTEQEPAENKKHPKAKWEPRFVKMVGTLGKSGLIDRQIAEVFGVSEQTIYDWKRTKPEFALALKKAKELANERVIESLFKRATGYSHPETHISVFQGRVIKTALVKHYAPDTTACIFWLKNRKPNDWKDRSENVVQNPDGSALEPITVKVIGGTIPKAKLPNEEASQS
jgi:DNA-binding XRE family transcriptional regulator